MRNLYLILIISIGFFLLAIVPKSKNNIELEEQLKTNLLINNEIIEAQQKEARYNIQAYPDYESNLLKCFKIDSLFFVYQEERSIPNWKNYIKAFKPENNYDEDFKHIDFSSDEFDFLNQNTEYEVLSNLILDSKINYFRYISWTFPMMEVVGSNISFDKFKPIIYQQKVFYKGEKTEIPIFLAFYDIKEDIQISEARLNGKLLPNNKIKIEAIESGKQKFEIAIKGEQFGKMSQFFEFYVK